MARKPHGRRYCRCTAPIEPDGQCLYRCPPNPGARARNKPVGVPLKPADLPTHSEVSAAFKRTGLHKPYESQPFTEKAAVEWRKRHKARKGNP